MLNRHINPDGSVIKPVGALTKAVAGMSSEQLLQFAVAMDKKKKMENLEPEAMESILKQVIEQSTHPDAQHILEFLRERGYARFHENATDFEKNVLAYAGMVCTEEGQTEINDGARVALCDDRDSNGAYVSSWTWVDFDGTPMDLICACCGGTDYPLVKDYVMCKSCWEDSREDFVSDYADQYPEPEQFEHAFEESMEEYSRNIRIEQWNKENKYRQMSLSPSLPSHLSGTSDSSESTS